MTPPKKWPYDQIEHRDRAAESAQESFNALRKVARQGLPDPAQMQLVSIAIIGLSDTLRHLEAAEARTRPQ